MTEEQKGDAGFLYVLTNPAMPGMVKIGFTTQNIEERIRELSATPGVPVRFLCNFAAKVPSMREKERMLHQIFDPDRVNPKREFFRLDPERVILAIKMGPYTEVTPGKPEVTAEEEKAFEKAERIETQRLARFTFDSVGIPVGALLRFTRDQTVEAVVEPGNKVKYDGQIHSITGAAKLALKTDGAVRGPSYWMYKGKTLSEIREAAGL